MKGIVIGGLLVLALAGNATAQQCATKAGRCLAFDVVGVFSLWARACPVLR